jgi:cell division septation protein DedD
MTTKKKMQTTPEVISRAQAKTLGLKTYFTGNPCLRGHIALRQTASETCTQCAKEKHKARYAADPTPYIARRMAAYIANPEAEREKMRGHYQKNKGVQAAKSRERYYADPESRRAASREWAARNPEKRKAQHIKRRAQKQNAAAAWSVELTALVALEAAGLTAMRERCTGISWHVDHMLPLIGRTVCGLHVWNNLQVIPAAMNMGKKNRMVFTQPGEWVARL